MKKAIPAAYEKYFNIVGVIADSEEKSSETHIVLDRQSFLAMFSHRENFFDVVTMFDPLRRSTIRALHELADKGIIGLDKDKPRRTQRCGSCSMRILVAVFMQLMKHTQTLIMLYRQRAALKELGDQIRAYIGPEETRTLVVHLRGALGKIERVEL